MERFDPPDAAAREMLEAWQALLQVRAVSGDEEARRRLAIVNQLRADLGRLLAKQPPHAAVRRFVTRELAWRFAYGSPAQAWRLLALVGAAIVLGSGALSALLGGSFVLSAGFGLATVLMGYLYARRMMPESSSGGPPDREA